MESGFAKGYLDWKKIRTLQLDNLDVVIAIIKRQVDKGLIELKN